jgi:hypothetical protein
MPDHMPEPQSRRCAIWVTPANLQKAQELADFVGVDVDEFVAYVLNELHTQETREGRMRPRASEAEAEVEREAERETQRDTAEVIPLREDQRRRRRRG